MSLSWPRKFFAWKGNLIALEGINAIIYEPHFSIDFSTKEEKETWYVVIHYEHNQVTFYFSHKEELIAFKRQIKEKLAHQILEK